VTPQTRTTVVVPCFNDGSTLAEAVRSIRHHGEGLATVVVNDGSTDDATLDVLSEFEREGVTVIHQTNDGLSAARMAGVRASNTRYVFPLDADDILATGALTHLADALDADQEANFAWGDCHTFGERSRLYLTSPNLDAWVITYCNVMAGSALFRRETLLSTGGWRYRDSYEDWDMWMTMAERGFHGVHLPIITIHYRIHGDRMHARALARHEDIVDDLRTRHPLLFNSRSTTRRRSRATWPMRSLYPLIERAPLSTRTRSFLYRLLYELSISRATRRLEDLRARLARRGRNSDLVLAAGNGQPPPGA
jgi:glycosyltransferase involved in cell wall biosynthesis